MARIEEAFKKILVLEFNSPANALHYNAGEKGYTYMGIYEHAHPMWEGWSVIKLALKSGEAMSKVSVKLFYNQTLTDLVLRFYKIEFWDIMRLDEIANQKIAEELFVFAVNAGIPTAVKTAQRVVGVTADGVLGSGTIKALNGYDSRKFDIEFDKAEIAHYEKLLVANSNFSKFIAGWKNRAVAV